MQDGRGLRIGTMIASDWRVEGVLGQGGFGVTYEAHRVSTGAHVALKEYMPSGLCTRIEGSTRVTAVPGPTAEVFKRGMASFMKEADTLARLDHPSIVRVSDHFEANSTAYMALDFIDGGSMADWLRGLRRRPTQDELDRILWSLTDALIQVHALFVLHRDIKPDNVMLRVDGTPVLIDFGAIKTVVSSGTRSIGTGTLTFVTDGYAPPEQYILGGEGALGPWSDVYSLAAAAYEAVTGSRPPSAQLRQYEIIGGDGDPYVPLAGRFGEEWRPSFLSGLDRALSLRRQDRPQSVMELRRALALTAPVAAPFQPATWPPPPQQYVAASAPISRERRKEQHEEPAKPTALAAQPPPDAFVRLPPGPAGAPNSGARWLQALGFAAILLGGAALWANITPRKAGAPVTAEPDAATAANVRATTERQETPLPPPKLPSLPKELALSPTPPTAPPPPATLPPRPSPSLKLPPLPALPPFPSVAGKSDPMSLLVPGSAQPVRDRLADGTECRFCPEMLVVPAGRFVMGSPVAEAGRTSGESQVPVTIARPFAVGRFAVTFDEWDACVADGGCGGEQPGDAGWGRGKRPVVNVSWDDANAFAKWLSGKTGRTYRLPSEAEREYVTRAGTTVPFWWGSTITPAQANYDGSAEPYKGGGSRGEHRQRTVVVDSFKPNPWGLYNVHGNVYEWTQDCWNDSNAGNPGDGSARTSGDCRWRVARGGSWYYPPQDLRSAFRDWFIASNKVYDRGFRLVRSLNP